MSEEENMGYRVELFIYDLSRGIAKTMSPTLLGECPACVYVCLHVSAFLWTLYACLPVGCAVWNSVCGCVMHRGLFLGMSVMHRVQLLALSVMYRGYFACRLECA